MHTTAKLLQRKQAAALSQSTSLLTGNQSDAPKSDDIFGHKTTEMVLGSDIRWNLEDDESILKFFSQVYKNLIEVWIEHLGDSAVERNIQSTKELLTIRNTLSVMYRILYAFEQISSNSTNFTHFLTHYSGRYSSSAEKGSSILVETSTIGNVQSHIIRSFRICKCITSRCT
jgi:hypothetical protein